LTDLLLPCLVCQRDGISPCVKTWGPFKEAIKAKANLSPLEIEMLKDTVEEFIPEPSRPPSTPIDDTINDEEGHMLDYIFGMGKWNDCFFMIISQIVGEICHTYGSSINCRSIRLALIAFAEADLLFKGASEYEQPLKDHSHSVSQELSRRNCRLFDAEEFYTIFFLMFSERCRCDRHYRTIREISEQTQAPEHQGVHLNKMMAIVSHFDNSPEPAPNVKHSAAWRHTRKFLASAGSMGNRDQVLKVASLFRRDLHEHTSNLMDFCRTNLAQTNGFFLLALENILTALLKIYLEQIALIRKDKAVQDAALLELKMYLCYSKKISWLPHPSFDESYLLGCCDMAFMASKLLCCIDKGPLIYSTKELHDYIIAGELVATAKRFEQDVTKRSDEMARRKFEWPVFSALGFASLIPPSEERNECMYIHKILLLMLTLHSSRMDS
jgi:hypothetical protein